MADKEVAKLLLSCLLFFSCCQYYCDAAAPTPSTRPGLFYVFMSGQIVVVDAKTGTTLKSIRQFNGAPAQIPNTCPGGALQGRWNDLALGLVENTIFATMSFNSQPPVRAPGLQNGVLVLNTSSQEIESIIPINGMPNAIRPVPEDGSVWVHSDTSGAFTLYSLDPSYQVEQVDLGKDTNVVAVGSLVTDPAMNGKGYMTSAASSGVYVYDIFARTGAKFMNFQTFQVAHHSWLTARGVYCPATSQAVYAPSSRRVFVACSRAQAAAGGVVTAGTNPGIVEISTDTDSPVDAWAHVRADKLYITPDETLVVALDSTTATINIIQPLPGVGSDQTMSLLWQPIYLKPGTQPDSIVFLPKGKHFVAFVSLLQSQFTAVLDFNILIPCGSYCPVATLATAVTYLNSGRQVQPRTVSSAVTTRPIAAGHHFVCVDSAVQKSLVCHNLEDPGNPKLFRNMKDIQQIIFVEGHFNGDEKLIPVYTGGKGVNTGFTC